MATTYIREKDKIDRYVDQLSKKYGGCSVSSGLRSRYYTVNHRVLRISDHIGSHNDAYLSIIVPSFNSGDNTKYVVHSHARGQVSIVTYEQVKEIVRSFFYLSSLCTDLISQEIEIKEDVEEKQQHKKLAESYKKLLDYKNKAMKKGKTILGIPMDRFSPAHLKVITQIVNKTKKTINEED